MTVYRSNIRLLDTVCDAIDALLVEGEYGEFLEAGMKCARDVFCRAASDMKAEERASLGLPPEESK